MDIIIIQYYYTIVEQTTQVLYVNTYIQHYVYYFIRDSSVCDRIYFSKLNPVPGRFNRPIPTTLTVMAKYFQINGKYSFERH